MIIGIMLYMLVLVFIIMKYYIEADNYEDHKIIFKGCGFFKCIQNPDEITHEIPK